MDQKLTFRYFYGNEADQYSFYRIPKLLFKNEYFKNLSSDAKILYGLMLDRMSLSIKNQWFDEQNRAYIYFSIEDIMELLNCGRNKAVKSLQELDDENGIGLIEKRRQGFGKANIIYVKSFMVYEEQAEQSAEEAQKFTKQTNVDTLEDAEVYKTNSNYNNTSDIKESKNNSAQIISDRQRSDVDMMNTVSAYQDLIKENIDYESLLIAYQYDEALIQGIYELILETVLCSSEKILIASNWYPAELVRGKFLKLNYSHIEYVLDCFKKNTSKVKNIKKYMLAALFNAPTTIDGYYKAEVNHDMPQFAV